MLYRSLLFIERKKDRNSVSLDLDAFSWRRVGSILSLYTSTHDNFPFFAPFSFRGTAKKKTNSAFNFCIRIIFRTFDLPYIINFEVASRNLTIAILIMKRQVVV